LSFSNNKSVDKELIVELFFMASGGKQINIANPQLPLEACALIIKII
jgi:hypothetical protein